MGMVDRSFCLSHPRFHRENLKYIITLLLENDYPLKFIFNTINTRIKYLISHHKQQRIGKNPKENNKKWLTIPFIQVISGKFKHVIKDEEAGISFHSINKLRTIKEHKDNFPTSSQMNVVYKLNCRNCNASYVGQTSRLLKTRIAEHKNHINRNTTGHSVITDHRISSSHEFDWENVEILDRERYLTKRLISEMLHIKRQKNSLNLHTEY